MCLCLCIHVSMCVCLSVCLCVYVHTITCVNGIFVYMGHGHMPIFRCRWVHFNQWLVYRPLQQQPWLLYSCACRQYADLDPGGTRCPCKPGFVQNDDTLTCGVEQGYIKAGFQCWADVILLTSRTNITQIFLSLFPWTALRITLQGI